MSLNEKHANDLYSAPALFGRVKTNDVFDGIFLFRYCPTPLRPSKRKRVKLLSSSSIPSSLHSSPKVKPARFDAMAAVLSGVHPSGIIRDDVDVSPRMQSLIIFALPAVSYVAIGTIPLDLR